MPQPTRQGSAGREQQTPRMPYQHPDSTDQTIEARADQSREILDVLKDRLLVSVLMRARLALGCGSLHKPAVWGGAHQSMQPEVTTRDAIGKQ